jgi:hypothetical protein
MKISITGKLIDGIVALRRFVVTIRIRVVVELLASREIGREIETEKTSHFSL